MQVDVTPGPTPLIDLKQVSCMLGMPQGTARAFLESKHDYPVAIYQGRPLWLSATVHDAIAARAGVAA